MHRLWIFILLCAGAVSASEHGISLDGNRYVELGQEIRLTCTAAIPVSYQAHIDWFKDGSKVDTTETISITSRRPSADSSFVSELVIDRSTVGDAGTYVCRSSDFQIATIEVIVLKGDVFNNKRDKALPGISLDGNRYVELGQEIRLTCTAAIPVSYQAHIDWFKDGSKVDTTETISITSRRPSADSSFVSELVINRSTVRDGGTYVCRSSNDQITSLKVTVLKGDVFNNKRDKALPGVDFSTSPETVIARIGESAILPCSVHSIQNYTVTWESGKAGVLMTGEMRVTQDPRYFLRQEDETDWSLFIQAVGEGDEGVYNCVINTEPPLTKDVTLVIGESVTIKASRARVMKQKGKRGKLECMVNGKPSPTTVWMKGDKEVKADNRHIIDVVKKGEYNSIMRLKIKRLKDKDFGKYTCQATNTFGTNSASINLVQPHRTVPTFDAKSENVSGTPGSTIALPCAVDSLGKHKVSWVDENYNVLSLEERRVIADDRLHVERSMVNSWDLVISDVTQSDAGVYTCQVNTNPPTLKTVTLRIGNAPVASTAKQSTRRSVGDDIVLSCTITGFPQDFVTWTLNSSEIPIGDKYDIRIEDIDNVTSILSLHVRSIQSQDFGLYTCRASNQFGSTQAKVTVLELEDNGKPRFDETPNNITVTEGSTASLPCSVVNLGKHRVLWVFGKEYLTMQKRVLTRDKRFGVKKDDADSWNLQIKGVKYRDAGIYRCRLDTEPPLVTSVFLNVEADAVSAGPMFESVATNVSVVAGSNAELACGVKALGRYQVVWLSPDSTLLTFKSKRVVADPRITIVRPFFTDWNLHISEVRDEDEGTYSCQINTSPIKVRNIHLTVQSPATLQEEWSSTDTLAQVGHEVELICNITGDPSPRVTWRRGNSEKLCEGTQFSGELGEILRIPKATQECDGSYECIAYNGIPPAVRYTIQLTIGVEPTVMMPIERVAQSLGGSTMLMCNIVMNPPDVMYWHKDGTVLEVGDKYDIEAYEEEDGEVTLALTVNDLTEDDFGIYTCIASNFFGQDEKTMTLLERVAPTTPSVPVFNASVSDDVMAVSEETVTLTCLVHNLGDNTITWYKNYTEVVAEGEDVVSANTRIQVHRSSNESWDLVIEEVTSLDAGVYTCQTDVDGEVLSRDVVLTVFVPAYFMSEHGEGSMEDMTVTENTNVSLDCNVGGDPEPTVTWSLPDSGACWFDKESHVGAVLNVDGVTRGCSGQYTCTANNGYGVAISRNINLMVQYAPEVSVQGDMVHELQSDVRLECRVVTLPLGTVHWYTHFTQTADSGDDTMVESRIEHDDKYSIEMRNEESLFTLTMLIRNIELLNFRRYTCRAENDLGIDEGSITLYSPAVVRPELSSEDTLVQEGKAMEIMCHVIGAPTPNVTWYKMSVDGDENYEPLPSYAVTEGSSLRIASVSREDQGIYKCMAENGYNSSTSHNYHFITVSVEYRPVIRLLPTEESGDGSTLLRCLITAFPQGIAMWKEDGVEVENTDRHQLEINYVGNNALELSLRIKSLGNKAAYYYTCLASNYLGESRDEVVLEGNPGAVVVDDSDEIEEVTEYDLTFDMTTVRPDKGGRKRRPGKDKDGHHHHHDKKSKGKKHKKGKKHHRKDKARKSEMDERDPTIHRIDNDIDEEDRDFNNVNEIDADDNRVEIPYKTGNDGSRSDKSRDGNTGGSSVLLPSLMFTCMVAVLGGILR